jgi:hypothetical protein
LEFTENTRAWVQDSWNLTRNRIIFQMKKVVHQHMNCGPKSRPVHRGPTLVGSMVLDGAEECQRCRAWILAGVLWGGRGGTEDLLLALTRGWEAMGSVGDSDEQVVAMKLVGGEFGAGKKAK